MTKSLANLEHQKLGVATSNRYVLHFDPAARLSVDRLPALYRQIEDRFSALPAWPASAWRSIVLWKRQLGECVIQQVIRAGPNVNCGST